VLSPGLAASAAGAGAAADGAGTGVVAQEASKHAKAIMATLCVTREKTVMALLLLEALGALLILIFIVWWTMFSGRKNGELKDDTQSDAAPGKPDDPL
jgi:hypothetical protein